MTTEELEEWAAAAKKLNPNGDVKMLAVSDFLALISLAQEALVLRNVAEAAGEFFADRGKIQPRSRLHDALSAYYKHLATNRPSPPTPTGKDGEP